MACAPIPATPACCGAWCPAPNSAHPEEGPRLIAHLCEGLFVSQGDHGIHAHGAAGGDVSCERGYFGESGRGRGYGGPAPVPHVSKPPTPHALDSPPPT